MKLTIRLDDDSLKQAISDFLRKRMTFQEIEHVEYLDEDMIWSVRVALPDSPPRVILRVDPEPPLEDLWSPPPDGEPPPSDLQTSEGDDEFGDGDDLPPFDESDLAAMGIDLNTPEGKIAAREARAKHAAARGGRVRNLQHLS